MTTLTITEALAELKLIDNKIAGREAFVKAHLYRNKALVDPLEKEGGSPKAVAEALQAINDLYLRKMAIRQAINMANQENTIQCGGYERSVEEWLIWRRLVFPQQQVFIHDIMRSLQMARVTASRAGDRLQAAQTQTADDIIAHLPEKDFSEEAERLQETYDKLDGLLSLKNAQTTISF